MTIQKYTVEVVKTLSEYFRHPLTERAVEAYMIGLEGLPQDELEGAAKRAITECRFMPLVSELLAFAKAARPKQWITNPIPD
jgi:hypothetical protein